MCEAITEGIEERKIERIDNKDEAAEEETEGAAEAKPRRERVRRKAAPKAEVKEEPVAEEPVAEEPAAEEEAKAE